MVLDLTQETHSSSAWTLLGLPAMSWCGCQERPRIVNGSRTHTHRGRAFRSSEVLE